jgi:hypothetical protein
MAVTTGVAPHGELPGWVEVQAASLRFRIRAIGLSELDQAGAISS